MTDDPQTQDTADEQRQAEDDELARYVAVLEDAGLVETYAREDGTIAVRLTSKGEELRQLLPEVGPVDGDGD